MSHRMFCSVYQAADHRRRKLSPADPAEITESRDVDCAQLGNCSIDTLVNQLQRLRYVGEV